MDELSLSCNDSISNNEHELSILNKSIRVSDGTAEELEQEDFIPKIKQRRSPKKPSLSSQSFLNTYSNLDLQSGSQKGNSKRKPPLKRSSANSSGKCSIDHSSGFTIMREDRSTTTCTSPGKKRRTTISMTETDSVIE